MKGALVFLAVFAIFLVITLGVPTLPPGRQIYDAIGAVETDFEILGVGVPRLVSSVFNGVVYGVIAFLIYSVIVWLGIFKKEDVEYTEEYKDLTKPM